MPIVRSYACEACNHYLEVTLPTDQWDSPAPQCPNCWHRDLQQDFKPVAIGGSVRARAVKIAETIAEQDYGVADMKMDNRQGGKPKVRYRDQAPQSPHQWGVANEVLQTAITLGRQTRAQYGGDGLDILQKALRDGTQPDLIEQSKRRSFKVY